MVTFDKNSNLFLRMFQFIINQKMKKTAVKSRVIVKMSKAIKNRVKPKVLNIFL